MGRLVLGAASALLVGLAVWAAWPSAPPLRDASGLVGPTPIVPTAPSREHGRERDRDRPTPPTAPATDLDVRIAGCIGAQRSVAASRAQRGAPAPAGQPSDAAMVSRGCAPLYKEAACRDAMMHFDEPPADKRSAAVLQACARAYCGQLPDPKPAACGHVDAVPEDEQQYTEWNDLRLAILTHDIGASAAQIVLSPPPRPR